MKTNCRYCGREFDETEASIMAKICPKCFPIYEAGVEDGISEVVNNPHDHLNIDELYREGKYS